MKYIKVKQLTASLIILVLFFFTQRKLTKAIDDLREGSHYINISGKQRMYSQRINSSIFAFKQNPQIISKDEIQNLIQNFKDDHVLIDQYLSSISNKEWVKTNIAASFQSELNEKYNKYIEQVDQLMSDQSKNINTEASMQLLIPLGNSFLEIMNQSVHNIELFSQRKIGNLVTTQWALFLALTLILALQAYFIILPMFKSLKQEITLKQKALDDLTQYQEKLVAQAKLASLGALSAGIAHEIKNPINLIKNAAIGIDEFIEKDLPQYLEKINNNDQNGLKYFKEDMQSVAKAGKIIIENGDRADSIVKSMLLQSRAGKPELKLVDINKLTQESFTLAYHTMRVKTSLPVETTLNLLESQPTSFYVYPQELNRALNNLLDNAYYALAKKFELYSIDYHPHLSLTISRNYNDTLSFIIEDNGIGIPSEIKDKILEPFYTTKPAGQGTGLGLSMVSDIIRIHKGELQIESTENEFTRVTFKIPQVTKQEVHL